MYIIYTLSLACVVYYLVKNKVRDVFAFSIFSSIIYFIPNLFGVVKIKYNGIYLEYAVDQKMYIIHLIYIFTLLLARSISRKWKLHHSLSFVFSENIFLKYIWVTTISLFLILISGLGTDLLLYKTSPKPGIFAHIYTIYGLILVLAFVVSYKFERWLQFAFFGCLLLLSVYQGHRSYIVFSFLAIATDIFFNKDRNIYNIRYIFILLAIFLFSFMGKGIIDYLRKGESLLTIIHYVFTPKNIINSIKHSEPFIVQFNLNTVITQNFRLPPRYLLRYMNKILVFTKPFISTPPHIYETFVQEFVPNINYGIAYNIFYELYAVMGMMGVFIVSLINSIILVLIDKLNLSNNKIISAFGSTLTSIFGFYIFRNSIENMILWFQIYAFIFIVGYIISSKFFLKINISKDEEMIK